MMAALHRAVRPVIREAAIAYYSWAQRDIDPQHPDVLSIALKLRDLKGERRPAVARSLCELAGGMCMRDPACPDTNCPGHPSAPAGARVSASMCDSDLVALYHAHRRKGAGRLKSLAGAVHCCPLF